MKKKLTVTIDTEVNDRLVDLAWQNRKTLSRYVNDVLAEHVVIQELSE